MQAAPRAGFSRRGHLRKSPPWFAHTCGNIAEGKTDFRADFEIRDTVDGGAKPAQVPAYNPLAPA
jgi:hypothetical protein